LFNRQIANGGPSRLLILKVSVILWIQRKHVNWFLKQLPWAMEGGLHIRYG
jgi:hypothetical protein